jgi:hypothetical protein
MAARTAFSMFAEKRFWYRMLGLRHHASRTIGAATGFRAGMAVQQISRGRAALANLRMDEKSGGTNKKSWFLNHGFWFNAIEYSLDIFAMSIE